MFQLYMKCTSRYSGLFTFVVNVSHLVVPKDSTLELKFVYLNECNKCTK